MWTKYKDIESQKDFALAARSSTPFTGILFDVRKRCGNDQTLDDVKTAWCNSSDAILKTLFNTKASS